MRTLRAWLLRIAGLFDKQRRDRELSAEIESNLALHVDDNLRSGMTSDEARRQALLKFGSVESVKESCRDRRGIPFLETTWQDVRFALRMLRKSPGFTAVAVLTLALGIGANAAIFSMVESVLLKPLPYPGLERMVFINEALAQTQYMNDSWPDFVDWRTQNGVFERMAAIRGEGMTVLGAGEPRHSNGAFVSASFFPMLAARAKFGRVFRESDESPHAPAVAVLSYSFWRDDLKENYSCLGRTLSVDGASVEIIGVLPASFQFPIGTFQIYLPISLVARDPDMADRANHPGVIVIATRRVGVSLEAARADMGTIMDRLAREYPNSNRNERAILTPLLERVIGNTGDELLLLLGAVGFVLLLACTNIAHLMLARAAGRQREFAIRRTLGATGKRLTRQVLAEGLSLAGLGCAAGLLLALWTIQPLVRLYPQSRGVPGLAEAHLDPLAIGFSVGLCGLAAVLFSLAPCWHATHTVLGSSLKEASASGTETRPRRQIRSALLVGEIALALVLLVSAGLTLRSLAGVLNISPGFHADHLLSLSVIRANGTAPGPGDLQFFSEATARISRLPGVQSVSAVMCPPFRGTQWTSPYVPAGRPAPPLNAQPWTALNMVLPGYFETMRAEVLQGRPIEKSDDAGSSPVAVVNETMARMLDPHANATGKVIHVEYAARPLMQVIGVVRDLKQWGLEQPDMPEVYVPAAQMPVKFMTVVVRTSVQPKTLSHAAILAIQSLDKDQPVFDVTSFTEIISALEAQRRFVTFLLTLFAALALVLATIGVFGVMAYTVAQRTREIGIRMALGAQRSEVLRNVLMQGLVFVGLGLVLGVACAIGLTHYLAAELWGVTPTDPDTFAAVAVLLTVVSLAACYVPARRAMRVDPVSAMRCE